jgi:glycosyltransferase
VYQHYGLFNPELGTAADYELMLRMLLKHNIKAAYIPEVLVKMRSGGVSNQSLKNRLKANLMDRKAWTVNDLSPYLWTLWMKPIRKLGQWVNK